MLDARLEAKISYEPNSGCWLWAGSTSDAGYGNVSINGRVRLAHRYIYELHKGPIPEGKQLDHLCRTRCCVNPAHLEPVTNKENCRRSPLLMAGRGLTTHCCRGHMRTEKNTQIKPNGVRSCRICRSITKRQRAARKVDALRVI